MNIYSIQLNVDSQETAKHIVAELQQIGWAVFTGYTDIEGEQVWHFYLPFNEEEQDEIPRALQDLRDITAMLNK